MKKSVRNTLTVTAVIIILLTVISAVFAYIAMANDFNHDIFHYNRNSINAFVGTYLPLVAAVVALECAFIIRKKVSFKSVPEINIPMMFASVLTGLTMLVSVFFGERANSSEIITWSGNTTTPAISKWVGVVAVICAVYFLLLPFVKKSFMTALSLSPAIWAALKLLEEYFREGEPINSPIRTANLAMFSLLLLFFAEDVRFGINGQIASVYYFCTFTAIAFTGTAVIPKLIIILSGNEAFRFNLVDWCLYAALFLFLLARLSSLPSSLGEYIPTKKSRRKSEKSQSDIPSDTDPAVSDSE